MTQVEHGNLDPDVADPEGGWPPAESEVVEARAGDRVTLGNILAVGYPRLVGFYRGMGLSRAEAEDLASEACEGMIKGIGKLRDTKAFEAWFWSVARNRLRTNLRQRGRRVFELEHAPSAGPEQAIIESEEHGLIRTALAALSVRDRELLWMREVEGLAFSDIGYRIGSRAGTARVAVHRARQRLEDAYRKLEEGG